jgi:hypothetical protein
VHAPVVGLKIFLLGSKKGLEKIREPVAQCKITFGGFAKLSN